ncbi:Retrovirus-related Pol polyprotein from transposon TNT 1-94 [Vitis vinifera]|uniref:Retrovirus-related Pol polyprotein from transposon TNT 1-94 n=1 Tax=Vitis vinifera TaxID=29760 RepID=A0A438FLB7_VITVI|nr:Retrovirus-related Pol polyprotein from transposon TNT 1-94 [Vitis vinifera]
MGTAKFNVEKFTGKNDFGLWRLKMRALLVQQGLQDALLGKKNLPSTMQEKQKIELLEETHSAIILSLGDTMLREVAKAKSAAELWLKLESLYMTKSLANRLHKKIKLYTFKMTLGMSIEEHLDHFNKIILDLENIDITVSDKDKAILLLTSLDASYTNMKEAIMYGRDSLIFDEVQSILHARELQKQEESKKELGEGLNIRVKSEKREKKGNNSKSRSKSKTKKFNVEVLNVAEVDSSKKWILDSGCSFRMCPIKAWFEDFKEADGGHVLLGNNKHCKILGIGTVRIKHYEGIERVFEDVRPDYDKQSFYCAEGGCGDNQAMEPIISITIQNPSRKVDWESCRYQHLKVFGCTTYVHTKTDKLEPQAVKCIFLGYPKGVKGYKLWIETQGQREVYN